MPNNVIAIILAVSNWCAATIILTGNKMRLRKQMQNRIKMNVFTEKKTYYTHTSVIHRTFTFSGFVCYCTVPFRQMLLSFD